MEKYYKIGDNMKINKNYENVEDSYLFSTIAKKVSEFVKENQDKEIIKLGIGDVTLPLCPAVISAMHNAVDEMSQKETFKGYGPEQGYAFLKDVLNKKGSVIPASRKQHIIASSMFFFCFT